MYTQEALLWFTFAVCCLFPALAIKDAPVFLAADNPKLQYTGRVVQNGSHALWEFPGTKVGVQVKCSGGPLTIKVHITVPQQKLPLYWIHELTKYIVLVDGTRTASFQTKEKTSVYSVTLPAMSSGTHVIEVFKNTERLSLPMYWSFAEGGEATAFGGIEVPETCTPIAPPSRPLRRLEFVGDSITCGFGNLASKVLDKVPCAVPTRGWLAYEDFDLATPSLAARAFHAETHTECISQVGITRDGTTPARTTAYNMSRYIHRTLPTLPDTSLEWDYTQWTPDLAIVNLGTNDYDISQMVHAQPSFADFEGNYSKLLEGFVSHYQGKLQQMLVLCGPMTKTQCPSVKKVATALNSTFPSLNVRYQELTLKSLNGCVFHPDVDGHRSIMEQVSPTISEMTGWEQPETASTITVV